MPTSMESWTRAHLHSIGVYVRKQPYVALGVVINLLFVFLPFFDPNNFGFFVKEVAGFTAQQPSLASAAWPAGFFSLAPLVAGYLAYFASGFQVYWSVTVLKLMALAFTGMTAWLVYRIGRPYGSAVQGSLAAFVLLNPVLLFLNYIWVIWDPYPIFFLFLGYYILRYDDLGLGERARTLVGVTALMVSVLFYWYALLAVPVLILYARTTEERVRLFLYCAGLFAALAIVDIVLFVGWPVHYLSELLGHAPFARPVEYFGLPYYVRLGTVPYLALVGLIAVAVPAGLRAIRFSESAALLVVLLLFVWTSPVQALDNYAWILWFVPLLFLHAGATRIPRLAAAGLLGVPLLGIALASVYITNGQPDGQGILYWGYPLFHSSYEFLPTLSDQAASLAVWNALAVVAVAGTILLVSTTGRYSVTTQVLLAPAAAASAGSLDGPLHPLSRKPSAKRLSLRKPLGIAFTVLLGLALAGGSLAFNAGLPNLIDYHGDGTLPLYALNPSYYGAVSNVPCPLPGATYGVNGSTVAIAASAQPLGLSPTVSDRSLAANVSFQLSGLIPLDTLLVQGSSFNLSLLTLWTVDERGYPTLPPLVRSGVANVTLGYPLMNASPDVRALGPSSVLEYSLNATNLSTQYFYWAFQFARSGGTPVPIFQLASPFGYASLVSFPDHASLTYGPGTPANGGTTLTNPYFDISHQWSFVGIHESGATFWLDFNGVVETVPAAWATGSMTLRLAGVTVPGLPVVASNQRVSPIYTSPGAHGPATYSFLNWSSLVSVPGAQYLPTRPSTLNYTLRSEPNGSRVVANGESFSLEGPVTSMFVGKGSPGNYSVTMVIHSLTMQEIEQGYYLVPGFAAVVFPFALTAWCAWRTRAYSR